MYVKLINEKTIENAPRVLRDDEKTYSNPLPETLAASGYLPLVETKMPEMDGYFFTKHYESDGNKVTVVWDKHEIQEPETLTPQESPAENVSDEPENRPENVSEPENEQTEPMESENEFAE